MAYLKNKYESELNGGKPIILLNGGAGKPESAMDAVSKIKDFLHEGYPNANVSQVYCDIKGGFPGEQKSGGIQTFKMMFRNRQEGVVSGDELIVFPGGIGTAYEFTEILVNGQMAKKGIKVYPHTSSITSIVLIESGFSEKFLKLFDYQLQAGVLSAKELEKLRVLVVDSGDKKTGIKLMSPPEMGEQSTK